MPVLKDSCSNRTVKDALPELMASTPTWSLPVSTPLIGASSDHDLPSLLVNPRIVSPRHARAEDKSCRW